VPIAALRTETVRAPETGGNQRGGWRLGRTISIWFDRPSGMKSALLPSLRIFASELPAY